MNNNNYGLKFMAEYSSTTVNYLDLTLTKHQNTIGTKTFFKETDRNGFVPTHSCHHPQWIGAVPKGQYMRLWHNCNNEDDFFLQAELLTSRFFEQGYPLGTLENILNQVSAMDRQSLLATKSKTEYKGEVAFVSGFHRQYKQVKTIFFKFWPGGLDRKPT